MLNDSLAQVRILETLHSARTQRASDVHIVSNVTPMLRVNGFLTPLGERIVSLSEADTMVRELLNETQLEHLHRAGDVTCTVEFEEVGLMRLHVSMTSTGPCIAIRMLDREIPNLGSIGLPPVVHSFCTAPHGLVIVAGATGSGKSTTLAALVEHINATAERRIISIEDPIEYRHISRRSLITQREIGRDVESFSTAALAALRGDPDILVVGEMRDQSTIRAVLAAAETGHLVFSTLHTANAAQTIDRIIDAFSEHGQAQVQSQLSQVLVAVIAQRLIPRANGPGRRAIAEVLVATDAVRNLIRDRKTHQLSNAIATGRASGMQSFEQHLTELVHEREIAPITVH